MQSPKVLCLSLTTLLLLRHCADSLIIPEELPTILSLIYSNIPPIKKGTDSRLGIGFRFGEHADFQILMELGPQRETDPIGTDTSNDTKRKRAAMLISAMKGELGPWAQAVARYQMEQKVKKALEKYKSDTVDANNSTNTNKTEDNKNEGSEWLTKWSQGLGQNRDNPVPMETSSTRKSLPNVNRMRVVNSVINSERRNDDLQILMKLLGPPNVNGTKSEAKNVTQTDE